MKTTSEHYKTLAAVMIVFLKEENNEKYILLQKRLNTGFADGKWDYSAAGHVDSGESILHAATREIKEELGISIRNEELKFIGTIHKNTQTNTPYYNYYFLLENTDLINDIIINEPDKCSELKWFPLKNLPDDLIYDRKLALTNFQNGILYDELNWNGENMYE